jgi:hypothetical protein
MSGEEERSEDLKALEAALAALVPRVEGFDRERLIFEAGRASALAEFDRDAPSPPAPLPKGEGRRQPPAPLPKRERRVLVAWPLNALRRWGWPAAFSAMTAVAATLLVALMTRPEPQVASRPAEPPVPAPIGVLPAEPPAQAPTDAYDWRLRERALLHGIDLWADPVVPQASGVEMARAPSSVLQLQRELMKESVPGGQVRPPSAPQWLSPFGDRS